MTAIEPLPDHVARNRAYWDETNAPLYAEPANGFEVLDLIEIRAPEGANSGGYELVDPAWARKWPAEEIWRARKG